VIFTHTRTDLGRLRATCGACGLAKSGPQPAVSRWQREHTRQCTAATRPRTHAS